MPQSLSKEKKEKKEKDEGMGASRASSTVEKKNKKETPDITEKGSMNDQIVSLMPKMNHSDWEKRRDSAEAIIELFR